MDQAPPNHDLSGARLRPRRRTAIAAVVALIAAVLTFSVAPAGAGAGAPSALGVQPAEVDLGGQNNDCSATITGRLPSTATYDFRIANPQDGVTYNGPGGVSITLAVSSNDKNLDYVLTGPAVVFDVIIKGGQKSTHFDYDGNGGPGGATADQDLHAPTKGNGNNLFSISHVSFCYEDALPASGSVYVDSNQNGVRDGGEGPDAPRLITASNGASSTSTTSAADGSYTLYLESGGTYTICEENIPDFVQTAPDNLVCADPLVSSEDGGHVVTMTEAKSALDFGNVPQICGQILNTSGVVFSGNFELFAEGNSESGCDDKIGQLSETFIPPDTYRLDLPLVGTGEVAGIGVITKQFDLMNEVFVPLTYSKVSAGPFAVLPWCGLRPKAGTDGDQFDPYLTDPATYPTITTTGDVSCKVYEDENASGTQTTVVLILDDPFWQ